MNTNSNSYTIIYASIMVVIVAFLLAFVSSSLKEKQYQNVEQDIQVRAANFNAVNIDTQIPEAEINLRRFRIICIQFVFTLLQRVPELCCKLCCRLYIFCAGLLCRLDKHSTNPDSCRPPSGFCRTQVCNWHSGKSMDCLVKLCGQRAEKLGCFFPASKCRKYLNECIQRNE